MGHPCKFTERQCPDTAVIVKKERHFPANEKYPPYLPQPNDQHSHPLSNTEKYEPWATGRVTWSQTAGLVGVRPIVDRYSITKYGLVDWRKKNLEILDLMIDTNQLKKNVHCSMDKIVVGVDKHQSFNTTRLEERLKEVRVCQGEIEALVKELREEIVLLSEMKIRLKFALPALKMPELISGECINIRSNRLEPDLVYDEVEMELIKESAMIKEIRVVYEKAIEEIEKQMLANRACKDQLELTWSDKKETCELESINVCLRNTTPIILHHGGAARVPANQSSPESWAVYNTTLITMAKEEINKSQQVRHTAENTLLGSSIRDLHHQAEKVYFALQKRIEETDQCRQMFERELQDVLRQISDAESLYEGLLKLQRQLDINSKVVETRLDNRLYRPRVENCKDEAFYGLMDEVKYLNISKSELKMKIYEIDKVVARLYETRSNLEYVILTKRKSLYVDQQRCMAYREKYPDAVTMSGGNSS